MRIDNYIEVPNHSDWGYNNIKQPNVFLRAIDAIKNNGAIITELNKICKIEFIGDMVSFTPRIDHKKFGGRGHQKVYLESRQYVSEKLQKLGFATDIDKKTDGEHWPNCSVYVNMKKDKNLKLIQRYGSEFGFYYKRPLNQQDINEIKKGHQK